MRASQQFRVSPSLISGVLIGYSALWCASALVFYLTNRQSKDGWSAAPLSVMWALVILPSLELVLVASLLGVRRAHRQRLTVVDYFAIGAAAAPFVFIGLLFLIFFLSR